MESSESTPEATPAPEAGAPAVDSPPVDLPVDVGPPGVRAPEEPADGTTDETDEPPYEIISPGIERFGTPRGAALDVPVSYPGKAPSFVFLTTVSIVSLASDIATKLWAEHNLDGYPGVVTVWENHIAFVLAKNRGGAWGLLQSTNENVRRPFFLLVSAAAIAFIVTLYRRLMPTQRALKWGLPLVLGGALGNVFDRIRYGHVIDFIDFHMKWKEQDHHWPTFNVADIAICVGVGLMAIDMFTSKRPRRGPVLVADPQSGLPTGSIAVGTEGIPGGEPSQALGEGIASHAPGEAIAVEGVGAEGAANLAPIVLPSVAAEPSPAPATDVPKARDESSAGAPHDTTASVSSTPAIAEK